MRFVCFAMIWALVLLASSAQVARAVGLPFVDLPTAGDVASDAIDSASRAIVGMVAGAVAELTNEIIRVSDTVGAPQVGSANTWFTASYKRTMSVSLWLMAIAALIGVTSAGLRGKSGEMLGVIFVNVPGSIVAMMLVTVGVQLSLGLVDAMTAYTFRGSVDQIQTFLHDIGTVFTSYDGAGGTAAAQLAPGLSLIIGLLVIVMQLVILAVLVIRAALIYIVTLFLPLVLAMQVWPSTRHMTRKSLELLAVLIFSKFAIFTCLALGASAATDVLKPQAAATRSPAAISTPARGADNAGAGVKPPAVQSAIVGLGVMAAAAFSPMLLMSIIPGIAGSFGAGIPGGGGGGHSGASVRTPSQIMRSTLSAVHTVRGGGGGGSGGRSSGKTGGGSSGGSGRVPSPPGGGASSSGAGSSSAAREGAHAPDSRRSPAVAPGAANTASVMAQGTQGATHPRAASGPSSNHSPTPPASPPNQTTGEGPHVVGSNRPSSTSASSHPSGTPAPAARAGATPDRARASEHPSGSSAPPTRGEAAPDRSTQQMELPLRAPTQPPVGAGRASRDGFQNVQTRQPFTMETT